MPLRRLQSVDLQTPPVPLQTGNTSTTMQYLAAKRPAVVLNVGDLAYADDYNPGNTTYNFAQQIARFAGVSSGAYQVGEQPNDLSTNQLRWDTWGGVPGIQTLFGSTLVVNAAGNHEIEGGYCSGSNTRKWTSWLLPVGPFSGEMSLDGQADMTTTQFISARKSTKSPAFCLGSGPTLRGAGSGLRTDPSGSDGGWIPSGGGSCPVGSADSLGICAESHHQSSNDAAGVVRSGTFIHRLNGLGV